MNRFFYFLIGGGEEEQEERTNRIEEKRREPDGPVRAERERDPVELPSLGMDPVSAEPVCFATSNAKTDIRADSLLQSPTLPLLLFIIR